MLIFYTIHIFVMNISVQIKFMLALFFYLFSICIFSASSTNLFIIVHFSCSIISCYQVPKLLCDHIYFSMWQFSSKGRVFHPTEEVEGPFIPTSVIFPPFITHQGLFFSMLDCMIDDLIMWSNLKKWIQWNYGRYMISWSDIPQIAFWNYIL